jgi:hypothetical protein
MNEFPFLAYVQLRLHPDQGRRIPAIAGAITAYVLNVEKIANVLIVYGCFSCDYTTDLTNYAGRNDQIWGMHPPGCRNRQNIFTHNFYSIV